VPVQRAASREGDVRVAAVPTAASAARSAVVGALSARVDVRVLADATQLVSEPVSDSVLQGRRAIVAPININSVVTGGVRLEVHDPGDTGTIAARDHVLHRGGFGGCLVEARRADSWGVSRNDCARVWVELVSGPRTDTRDA
jgi:hypothetical protein